ncbi:MAG TPA: hypothetical protein PK331_02545 [Gordonia sp. (in: high G+C Gram-positive bacteria)]|uniref:hypothetical protein n=1 Tax=unclassified Gordonia (in: high G+C Gram-positive bacteria) TaxID=2657482 RepID=UPI000F8FC097|nr:MULTISPECIES: hypothetical protein [unclassified Gordonia (in: high G+C Gram-positive bacteria)]RTL04428.1 MAG: hypothetical protein EKK62_16375 [Acidimicrobiia bacterium]HNP56114.1 hypothetical protein [Gordonia sp. (in: high G+C Gram-positive bacteria)]HRC49788.1 hypothetical protein [Gordonia sp. (in: high G+C Gram-positive bacteria)]
MARTAVLSPVLVRGANQLQLGCDPERSVLVDLPPEVSARAVADLLHLLDQPQFELLIAQRCDEVGLGRADFDAIVTRLRTVGASDAGSLSQLRIHLHGAGPLRDGLDTAMTAAGYPVALSAAPRARPWRAPTPSPTLVVLTDYAHHDPVLVDDLMRRRIPHLSVLLRDGVGVVGPLVLPGRSSCLRCADHHRTTLDPQWPLLCAQLVNRSGVAGHAVTGLTVGVALEQIEQVSAGLAPRTDGGSTPVAQPDLVDRTVEIHARPVRLRHKEWPAHPLCGCGAHGRRA